MDGGILNVWGLFLHDGIVILFSSLERALFYSHKNGYITADHQVEIFRLKDRVRSEEELCRKYTAKMPDKEYL